MNFEKNESKQVAVIQLRYQTLSILNSLMAVYIHNRIQNSVYKSDSEDPKWRSENKAWILICHGLNDSLSFREDKAFIVPKATITTKAHYFKPHRTEIKDI